MTGPSDLREVHTGERFLLVRCGSSCIGLPMARVRRVLRSLRTFPVPGSRPELVGLLQHAGEPLAVLDLGALVDGEAAGGGGASLTVILAVNQEQPAERIGVAVHDAVSVVQLSDKRISPSDAPTISGEAMVNGELVRLLDPSALSRQSA